MPRRISIQVAPDNLQDFDTVNKEPWTALLKDGVLQFTTDGGAVVLFNFDNVISVEIHPEESH